MTAGSTHSCAEPNRLLEVPVRVSIFEQVNVMAPMTPDTKTARNSTFKTDLLAAVDSDLHPADVETLSHLIDEFEYVFSKGDYDLGAMDIVTYLIDTGDHKLIRRRSQRNQSFVSNVTATPISSLPGHRQLRSAMTTSLAPG